MKKTKEITLKLSEFASIEVGYPLHRGTTLFEPYHTYKTYQNPSCSDLADTFCYVNPIPEQYLTREGDIILNTAKLKDVVLIDKEHEGLLVSNRYLIIRCNTAKTFPGYICYEMLRNNICEKRKKICRDAVLPYQKAKKYAELKFKLPDLEFQEVHCEIQRQLEESLQKNIDSWLKKRRREEEERQQQYEARIEAIRKHYLLIPTSSEYNYIESDDDND